MPARFTMLTSVNGTNSGAIIKHQDGLLQLSNTTSMGSPSALTIDPNGNVGIGAEPASTAKLSISDNAVAAISISNTSGRAYELISTPTGKFGIFDRDAVDYRLTIDDTGNVGIGMTPLRSTAKEQLA